MNRKVLILLPLAFFLLLYYPLRVAIVDDTFIHLQYARNLAELHELSFNPHEPSYGATSPLWVFILSVVYLLHLNPVVACRVFSVLLAIFSIVIFHNLIIRISGDRLIAFLCAAILSTEAWFVRWSSVGMETSLGVFMLLVAMYTLLKANESNGASLLHGFVLFLAVLARPELVIAFLVFIISSFIVGGRKGPKISGVVIFLALYASWLLIIHHHTGTYFPLTAGAKQGRLEFGLQLLKRAAVPLRIIGATLLLPMLAILMALILGIARGKPLRFFRPEHFPENREAKLLSFQVFSLIMVFALPAAYVVMDFQIISRYLVPIVPLAIAMGLFGLKGMIYRLVRKEPLERAIVTAISIVVIAQSVLFYSIVVVPPTREFSNGLNDVLVRMGVWLNENTPESTVVALPDIGAVGYYSRRKVLDLGGLVSPQINEIRSSMDYEKMMEEGLYLRFNPDYLIDRSTVPERFSGRIISKRQFIPVLRGEISALGIRKKGPFTYVLYRIEKVEGH